MRTGIRPGGPELPGPDSRRESRWVAGVFGNGTHLPEGGTNRVLQITSENIG